jgi:hypothetical protein
VRDKHTLKANFEAFAARQMVPLDLPHRCPNYLPTTIFLPGDGILYDVKIAMDIITPEDVVLYFT